MAEERKIICPTCEEETRPGGLCEYCGSDLPAPVQVLGDREPPPCAAGAATGGADDFEIEDDPWGEQSALDALHGVRQPASSAAIQPHLATTDIPPGAGSPIQPQPAAQPQQQGMGTAPWRVRIAAPELVLAVADGAGVVLGRVPPSPLAGHALVTSYVSSRHARVWIQGGELFVTDLGSTNGTWLGGMKLQPGVPNALRPGDVIQLTRDNPVRLEVLR